MLDLVVENCLILLEELEIIYCNKTGVLMCCVICLGVLVVGEKGCVMLLYFDCYVEVVGFVF